MGGPVLDLGLHQVCTLHLVNIRQLVHAMASVLQHVHARCRCCFCHCLHIEWLRVDGPALVHVCVQLCAGWLLHARSLLA